MIMVLEMRRPVLILFVLLIGLLSLKANPLEKASTFAGRHFFVGFMQNENELMEDSYYVQQLYIFSEQEANVLIRYGDGGGSFFTCDANKYVKVDVPLDYYQIISESINNRSIEILSDKNINVYGYSSQKTTSDCFTAIPINNWGTEYVVTSYPNDQYLIQEHYPPATKEGRLYPRPGEFLVLASEDNTVVTMDMTVNTEGGMEKGKEYAVTLNRGECYLVQSSRDYIKGEGDITGTIVRSDKPIGLISGHVRTAIVQTTGTEQFDSKDHLAEMLLPTNAWGKEFFSVPFDVNRHGDLYRITAIEPDTYVYYNDGFIPRHKYLEKKGDFVDLEEMAEPIHWNSTNPVQIAQMMMHNAGPETDNGYFDPCMVMLPAVENYVTHASFRTVSYYPTQYDFHSLYLVIKESAMDNFTMNGQTLNQLDLVEPLSQIMDTKYYSTIIDIEEGTYSLDCISGDFCGVVYGNGEADSYALTLGGGVPSPYDEDVYPPEVYVSQECGVIEGYAVDNTDFDISGIDFIMVFEDSVVNYEYWISEYGETGHFTSNSFTISAEPIDMFEDGQFIFDVRDHNGNGQQYKYVYHGIHANFPHSIDFGDVRSSETPIESLSFENFGEFPIHIENVHISGDDRLSLLNDIGYPTDLPPGKAIPYLLEFRPLGDLEPLNAEIIIEFDCSRTFSIPVSGRVLAPELTASGYDFGEVMIGEKREALVKVFNNGNDDIIIHRLEELTPSPIGDIWINGDDILPFTLPPGDSLDIPCGFEPDERGQAELVNTAVNNYELDNIIVVRGVGIAPAINSVQIDWGPRRVGTMNDTTITINNTGNTPTDITISDGEKDPAIDVSNIQFVGQNLPDGEYLERDVSFSPDDTEQYNSTLTYTCTWPLHGPITVDLSGRGTLPAITASDHDMGQIKLWKTVKQTYRIVASHGNEALTIDSIRYYSGDSAFIRTDYDGLDNIILDYSGSNTFVDMTFEFGPEEIRDYSLTLEIFHDAMPGYNRASAFATITGEGIAADTTAAILSLSDLMAQTCITEPIDFVVTNSGNMPFYISSIDFDINTDYAEWAEEYMMPAHLEVGAGATFSINIMHSQDNPELIEVDAVINDTMLLKAIKNVEFFKPKLIINQNEKLEVHPGDTVSLDLSGSIPAGSEPVADIYFDIKVPARNLLLLSKLSYLYVTNSGGTISYDLELDQNLTQLTAQARDVDLSQSADWSLSLPMLSLLSDLQVADISVTIEAGDCYYPETMLMLSEIVDVCAYPFRSRIIFNPDLLPEIKVNPNPVLENINLDFILLKNDEINITLYGLQGKKYVLCEKLYLKKGSHSLIFEVMNLPSGVYIMSASNAVTIRNSMFIKIK